MAFKILSGEELSLLDDNQRKHYESDLNMYQQRVAFVEQLELLENAEIQPYEPQLRSIPVMGEIEKRTFTTPEYAVSVCAPVAKPELHVRPFKMAEPVDPVLPVLSKRPEVHVEHITKMDVAPPKLPSVNKPVAPSKDFKKAEIERPNLPVVLKVNSTKRSEVYIEHITRMDVAPTKLPSVSKPIAPSKDFKKAEIERPNLPAAVKVNSTPMLYTQPKREKSKLPTVVKPIIQADLLFNPVNIYRQDIQTSLPNIVAPNIDFNAFSITEGTQHSLPEVAVYFADVKSYNKPKRADITLPEFAKPEVNVKSFEKAEPIQVTLPELSNITPVKTSFKIMNKANPELPTVVKPSTSVDSFIKPKHTKPKLPKTSKINLQPKTFSKYTSVSLDLPVVAKITATEKVFKIPEKPKGFIITVEPPKANVKLYKKVEVELTNLPNMGAISIPDAHDALKDLLPILNESIGK